MHVQVDTPNYRRGCMRGVTFALGAGAPGLAPVLLAAASTLRGLLLPLQQLRQAAHLQPSHSLTRASRAQKPFALLLLDWL